jgi:hypothetical protein
MLSLDQLLSKWRKDGKCNCLLWGFRKADSTRLERLRLWVYSHHGPVDSFHSVLQHVGYWCHMPIQTTSDTHQLLHCISGFSRHFGRADYPSVHYLVNTSGGCKPRTHVLDSQPSAHSVVWRIHPFLGSGGIWSLHCVDEFSGICSDHDKEENVLFDSVCLALLCFGRFHTNNVHGKPAGANKVWIWTNSPSCTSSICKYVIFPSVCPYIFLLL